MAISPPRATCLPSSTDRDKNSLSEAMTCSSRTTMPLACPPSLTVTSTAGAVEYDCCVERNRYTPRYTAMAAKSTSMAMFVKVFVFFKACPPSGGGRRGDHACSSSVTARTGATVEIACL